MWSLSSPGVTTTPPDFSFTAMAIMGQTHPEAPRNRMERIRCVEGVWPKVLNRDLPRGKGVRHHLREAPAHRGHGGGRRPRPPPSSTRTITTSQTSLTPSPGFTKEFNILDFLSNKIYLRIIQCTYGRLVNSTFTLYSSTQNVCVVVAQLSLSLSVCFLINNDAKRWSSHPSTFSFSIVTPL